VGDQQSSEKRPRGPGADPSHGLPPKPLPGSEWRSPCASHQKWCIHHTDTGSKYCSHNYQNLLRQHGFLASMSGKGNCYDNATVETFFKTIKAEMIWYRSWPTRHSAEVALFGYINGFYNPHRRRSALGWKCPLAYERKAA
jgi:transposase InsO family protein